MRMILSVDREYTRENFRLKLYRLNGTFIGSVVSPRESILSLS